jgi:hypothetical protein
LRLNKNMNALSVKVCHYKPTNICFSYSRLWIILTLRSNLELQASEYLQWSKNWSTKDIQCHVTCNLEVDSITRTNKIKIHAKTSLTTPHIKLTLTVTSETNSTVARQTIADCWTQHNTEICPAGTLCFEQFDISYTVIFLKISPMQFHFKRWSPYNTKISSKLLKSFLKNTFLFLGAHLKSPCFLELEC